MKLFASLLLSSLLSVVSSHVANDVTDVRIVINGLQGDLTPDDVQLAHDTIAALTSPSVASPKPVLRANIASATSDKVDLMLSTASKAKKPSCGGWGCGGYNPKNPAHQRSRWYGFGGDYSCGSLCHNDDKFLMDAVIASALIVSNVHSTDTDSSTEEKFCQILRQQGSSALSQVTTCTITPMSSSPSVSSLCVDGSKVGEALVFVDGAAMNQAPEDDDTRSLLTDEEVEALEKSVTNAYNVAYQEVGLVLESFEALNMAVPPADHALSNDESSAVVMGEYRQLCSDVDSQYETKDLEQLHQVFETLLCENLRDSGLPIFLQVKSCGYRTFHSHGSKSKVMKHVHSSVSEA